MGQQLPTPTTTTTTTAPSPHHPKPKLLPELIHHEILPRLPVEPLIRFKTVSKAFNAAISTPLFASLHSRLSPSTPNSNLLIIPSYRRVLIRSISSPPSEFRFEEGTVSVIGSCNGFIAISYSCASLAFIILNPSTRTYLSFPVPAIEGNYNLGLAYDTRCHQYKIVLVSDQYGAVTTRVTRVYSVEEKKMISMVSTILPSDGLDSMEVSYGGILINERLLHWRFWSPSRRKRRIGCFDVCTETWVADVLLPEFYYDSSQKSYLLDIGEIDGRLFSSFENRVDCRFDVWVMKEYGVQESWCKLLSVPVSEDLHGGFVPVDFRSGGAEVLLRQRHRGRLFWFNMFDHGLKVANEFSRVQNIAYSGAFVCKRSSARLPGSKLFGEVYEDDEAQ